MQNNLPNKILIVLIILLVGACSNKKLEDMGLLKKKASEYSIARKAPLIMPPDMYLSPPEIEKEIIKTNIKKNDEVVVTLDDILLGEEKNSSKKNKKIKRKKINNRKQIIKTILRTKAAVVLN